MPPVRNHSHPPTHPQVIFTFLGGGTGLWELPPTPKTACSMSLETDEMLSVDRPLVILSGMLTPLTGVPGPDPRGGTGGGGPTGLRTKSGKQSLDLSHVTFLIQQIFRDLKKLSLTS